MVWDGESRSQPSLVEYAMKIRTQNISRTKVVCLCPDNLSRLIIFKLGPYDCCLNLEFGLVDFSSIAKF